MPTTTREDWTATAAAHSRHNERVKILRIASHYTTGLRGEHDTDDVLAIATPILTWLDQATSDIDRAARKAAIEQVDQLRWQGKYAAAAAQTLIEEAAAYHRFITA
jgi:hypothetical protein